MALDAPTWQGDAFETTTAWRLSATHFARVLTRNNGRCSEPARGASSHDPVIFVVDDDASMREALAGVIAAGGLRVECFASAQEFLRRAAPDSPACLLLDVRMPEVGGFELQHVLATAGRDLPVIFITGHGNIPMAVRAMKAGAFEFLPKPVQGEDLLRTVRQAVERDRQARARRAELAAIRQRRDRLSAREAEVLAGIVRGKLNKQIAAELGISENTVKVHRQHVMQKMGATNVAELVLTVERLL